MTISREDCIAWLESFQTALSPSNRLSAIATATLSYLRASPQDRPLVEVVARAIKGATPIGYGMTPAESAMYAQAAFDTIEAAGLRIVPAEPTLEMELAASARHDDGSKGSMYRTIYRAMIAAAPSLSAPCAG